MDELEKIKRHFSVDVEALDANIQILKNNIQTEKKKQEELVKSRKALELEVKTLDSHIEKYVRQQNDVKDAEQVTALGLEVDKSKLEKAAAEEKVLEMLFQEDEQKAKIQIATQLLANEEKRVLEEKNEIQKKIVDCDKAIADKHVERDAQLTRVEEPYNRGYENLRKKGKKIAVAFVTEENNCSGCNMTVAPQMLNEIRKKIAITTCQCARYLYHKD